MVEGIEGGEDFTATICAFVPAKSGGEGSLNSSASASMSISGLQTRVRKIAEERPPVWVTEACARVNVWWTRDRVNKLVEASLPNRKLVALAIDGEH